MILKILSIIVYSKNILYILYFNLKKNRSVYHFIALYSLESSVNVVWSAMTQYNITNVQVYVL
jgi:hypothetical protein